MITDEQVLAIVDKELQLKTLGVTEQYLEIHNPIYLDNKLQIDRIDRERNDDSIIVYLPVANERFYFAVHIDNNKEEVTGLYTEPYHSVYFRATSDQLSENELKSFTTLIPTESWNKGDLKKNKKLKYKFSGIEFLPNPEPDEFEDKLKKLLDFLEQDRKGIKQLIEKADGYIQVAMNIHNANGMIGGPTINRTCIKQMSDLGLEINFDMYLEGNQFK